MYARASRAGHCLSCCVPPQAAISRQLGPGSVVQDLFLDGSVVDYVVGSVQKAVESQWQMTRLDTKR